MITLTYQTTTLELSDRLDWSNELSWTPVEQQAEYATDGTLLIDVAIKKAGREIELRGVETQTWLTRSVMLQCKAWRALPAARFTLVVRGEPHIVLFDQSKGGFSADPIFKLLDGEIVAETLYRPTFWFIEAEE